LNCAVHQDREATGSCVRCGNSFCEIDRRVQARGRDLCQTCHLDPRARALPVEVPGGGWWASCARTLAQIVAHPNQSFRSVLEPVAHTTVLRFLFSVRLVPWGVAVGALFVRWLSTDPGAVAPIRTSIASQMVGLQLAQVVSLWALISVPLLIPFLYFLSGIAAHVVMALTGGAHRTIGATLRAIGYSSSVLVLVVGALEVPLLLADLAPEIWAIAVGSVVVLSWWLMAVALARTHGTGLVRGFLVAIVPLAVIVSVVGGMASLELAHLPFGEPVKLAVHPIP
jgi:hypothetical protein